MVRLWLFERAEGWVVNNDHIITGLHDEFLKNLDDLVAQAEREKLQLYLCFTEKWKELDHCPSPVQDPIQQEAYLEHAVRPIARRFKGRDVIWAYDVFNEIESECQTDARYHVSVKEAQEFVKKTVEAIKSEDPDRKVSCGSGWNAWKKVQEGLYDNLGLDFFDFHDYSDENDLPHVSELNVKLPVYVGECGPNNRDDDEVQRHSMIKYLDACLKKGYSGCFVWCYCPDGEGREIVRQGGGPRPAVASIRDFIQSRRVSTAHLFIS